jgi:hypothetical protein
MVGGVARDVFAGDTGVGLDRDDVAALLAAGRGLVDALKPL